MYKRKLYTLLLRPKLTLLLGSIFLLIGIIGYFIAKYILLENVLAIESQLIRENINRVNYVLKEEIAQLEVMSKDWAHWDDTYDFARNNNNNYLSKNLYDDAFNNNKWSYFFIFKPNNYVFYVKAYDLVQKKINKIPSETELLPYFYAKSYLFNYATPKKPTGGLVILNNELQFTASVDIRKSNQLAPPYGHLVIMRPLSSGKLVEFSKQLELPLELKYRNASTHNSSQIFKDGELEKININKNVIHVDLLLRDVNNKPQAILSFKMKRSIYQNSENAITFFLLLLGATGIISLGALGLLIDYLIIQRIELFNHQIINIAKTKNYQKRVQIPGNDELFSMSQQVNELLIVIESSQKHLEKRNKKLQELELEKRNIIMHAPEPMIIININKEVVLINNETETIFGCKLSDLQGLKIDTIFTIEKINEKGLVEKPKLSSLIDNSAFGIYEITYKEKTLPIELNASLIENNNTIYIFRNISERKRHEEELAQLNHRLILLSRDAGKSDISTMLVHTIGNILNGVLVTITLLQEGINLSKLNNLDKLILMLEKHSNDINTYLVHDEKGKKIPAYITLLTKQWGIEKEHMSMQLVSMQNSVEELMKAISIYQVDEVGPKLIEKIDISHLLDNVIEPYTNQLKKLGIKLNKNYQQVEFFYQDRYKIWNIINNLLTNAIDAVTDPKKEYPLIEITMEKIFSGVRIKIIDNGDGIDKLELTKIFQFLYTTKKHGHGTGLHTCSIIAQEIGASVIAESKGKGEGATFIVDIPGIEFSNAIK